MKINKIPADYRYEKAGVGGSTPSRNTILSNTYST